MDEREMSGNEVLFEVVAAELAGMGLRNVAVYKGIAGIGQSGLLHTTTKELQSFNLPVVIEASDVAEKIDSAAREIGSMRGNMLIEVTPMTIVTKD